MSDIERTTFGPPDDTPILPWYGGAFSQAFVALHPFFTVEGLDPSACQHGTFSVLRSEVPEDADLLEWLDEEASRQGHGKELNADSVELISKRFGKKVDWSSIWRDVGFLDHCDLDTALRTNIHGLRSELEDHQLAKRLTSYCRQSGIFLPTEGSFQPLMQADLTKLFRRAGYSSVIAGDEFGDDDRLVDLALLEQQQPWAGMDELSRWGIRRLIAPDRRLLVWVHWDSFYTVIFGGKSIGAAGLCDLFEGFWCSQTTTTYWLTQPCIPLSR